MVKIRPLLNPITQITHSKRADQLVFQEPLARTRNLGLDLWGVFSNLLDKAGQKPIPQYCSRHQSEFTLY